MIPILKDEHPILFYVSSFLFGMLTEIIKWALVFYILVYILQIG